MFFVVLNALFLLINILHFNNKWGLSVFMWGTMNKYLLAAIGSMFITGAVSGSAFAAYAEQDKSGVSSNPEYYGLDESGITLGMLSTAAGGHRNVLNDSNPEYYSREQDNTEAPLGLLSTYAGGSNKAVNNSNPEYYTSEGGLQ